MTWISTAKLAAVSIGAALTALAAAEFIPRAWSSVGVLSSLGAWMKPPYVYVVVNGIIISIVASSRFHFNRSEKLSGATSSVIVVVPSPEDSYYYYHQHGQEIVVVKEVTELADDQKNPRVEMLRKDDHDLDDINLELSAEKPRRKLTKQITPTQDGLMALKASKPNRHESFENTWKKITEGRQTPLARQMKKCDTWDSNHRQIFDHEVVESHAVEKFEMFKDKANRHEPAVTPSSLRKEPSLSQDELNKRVEAFIKKFNEEMRLQRQESLNQYMEMINRGAS